MPLLCTVEFDRKSDGSCHQATTDEALIDTLLLSPSATTTTTTTKRKKKGKKKEKEKTQERRGRVRERTKLGLKVEPEFKTKRLSSEHAHGSKVLTPSELNGGQTVCESNVQFT